MIFQGKLIRSFKEKARSLEKCSSFDACMPDSVNNINHFDSEDLRTRTSREGEQMLSDLSSHLEITVDVLIDKEISSFRYAIIDTKVHRDVFLIN